MKENKKIIHKLNIVDLLVILVVLILLLAAWLKFQKFNSKTDNTVTTILAYQFAVYNVRDYTANAFQIGDTVFDSQSGVDIGKITSIEQKSAETYEGLINGETVKVKNPNKFDVVLTIETPGTVESNAYFANKSIELKVNSEKTIETKYVKTSGKISNLEIK